MKKVNKKPLKKVSGKSNQELVIRIQPQEITVPTMEVFEPLIDGKKMTLVPSVFNEAQLLRLVSKTPAQHIYERPGKGGQKWKYVTGNYVEKVLNNVFAWNWDFDVLHTEEKYGQVIVRGKLTVRSKTGVAVSKMQTGRADIKYLKNTKTPLDYGNDEKAATTDCLKKCASMLGIASDIYGKQEYKQEANIVIREESISLEEMVSGPDGDPVFTCKVCGDPITEQEAGFSKKLYGKTLCREHQVGKRK